MSDLVGADRELSRATDRITAALVMQVQSPESAPPDELRAAFGDYVTALGSNSTKMIAGGLVGVYNGIEKITVKLNDFAEHIDHRFDAYGRELDAYRGELATQRQQTEALRALLEGALVPFGEIASQVEELRTGQQAIIDRLDDDERRLDAKRQRLDAHEIAIAELQLQRGASIDALWAKMRLWFLLVMVVVVIVNLAIWIF